MASQKFLSPGVFSEEIDQSFLAQGVAGIGAGVVGRTPKGRAFIPVKTAGFDDWAERFGPLDPKFQMPYAARNYLKNSNALQTTRVLGHADGSPTTNGYKFDTISGIVDAGARVFAVLHHSGSIDDLVVEGAVGTTDSFTIDLLQGLFTATASLTPASPNYIDKVLNTDPTKFAKYGHYLYSNFKYVSVGSASFAAEMLTASFSGGDYTRDYEHGVTPWVISQAVGGNDFDMFRFHTLADGRATNDEIKVMIANVRPSASPTATPFGTFDVIVRKFYDSDLRVEAVETFPGCTMDKTSPNYILRFIGDLDEEFDTTQRKMVVASGQFRNKSKYVRVELNTDSNTPDEALPWGHRGYDRLPFDSGSEVPDMALVLNQKDKNGSINTNIAFGVAFLSGGVVDRMRALPNGFETVVEHDSDFSLRFLSASYENGKQVWSYDVSGSADHTPVPSSASLYKFSMPFQGGFDGFDLRVVDPLYLTNVADESDIGVVSLNRALDVLSNPDFVDINLLAVPAIHNIRVTDHARNLVNERRDALYIMDITGSSVAEAVAGLRNREIDDNYTATYYPDLRLDDKINSVLVRVAPSVAMLGVMAFNDRVGQVFFAPAGFNRGGMGDFNIVDVLDRLTFRDRDELYENRINPIATFPNEGIVALGQKTLQIKASALDRINVRRLLIFAKKTVASAAKFLLFEPNNPQTWQRFTNLVNPILDDIRQKQGINRFKVVMDTSTNTADVVDRNIMRGKIFMEPTKSGEFIDLAFVITSSGVAFSDQ